MKVTPKMVRVVEPWRVFERFDPRYLESFSEEEILPHMIRSLWATVFDRRVKEAP